MSHSSNLLSDHHEISREFGRAWFCGFTLFCLLDAPTARARVDNNRKPERSKPSLGRIIRPMIIERPVRVLIGVRSFVIPNRFPGPCPFVFGRSRDFDVFHRLGAQRYLLTLGRSIFLTGLGAFGTRHLWADRSAIGQQLAKFNRPDRNDVFLSIPKLIRNGRGFKPPGL